MDHKDQIFEGSTVELDGNSFVNCTFRDVTFVFGGGQLDMTNCQMESFRFQFAGDLARGLHALYQLFGTDGMLSIIRGFTQPSPGPVEIMPPTPGRPN